MQSSQPMHFPSILSIPSNIRFLFIEKAHMRRTTPILSILKIDSYKLQLLSCHIILYAFAAALYGRLRSVKG